MKTAIIVLVLATGFGCATKEKEPCSGMNFESEALPMTFSVSKNKKSLGKVTMDAKHDVTFAPAADADPKILEKFLKEFENRKIASEATYTYNERTKDMHRKCGGSVDKGTPQFPGAFKMSIYSDYYDVDRKL